MRNTVSISLVTALYYIQLYSSSYNDNLLTSQYSPANYFIGISGLGLLTYTFELNFNTNNTQQAHRFLHFCLLVISLFIVPCNCVLYIIYKNKEMHSEHA